MPDYLFAEIAVHRDELSARMRTPPSTVDEALDLLRRHLIDHRLADYEAEMAKAQELLQGRDPKDAPYVALALALGADGVWSQDRGLVSQAGFRVFRTEELLRMAERDAPG